MKQAAVSCELRVRAEGRTVELRSNLWGTDPFPTGESDEV